MRWYKRWSQFSDSRVLNFGLVAALVLMAPRPLEAKPPGWLQAAARAPLPAYPEGTEAVMLLSEQITTVSKEGDVKTRYRIAYKILRPEGRRYGLVTVHFDNDTRLTYFKAWSLPARGDSYEVKEKEAVETSPFSGVLFQDQRLKTLQIPAAHPGNVVGYEYEQEGRPFILQDSWGVGQNVPVRRASYTLKLPRNWEFNANWVNHPNMEPRRAGRDEWVWELTDIPAEETEPAMPAWGAVAGRLVLGFFPTRDQVLGESHATWQDVGRWYSRLALPTRQSSLEIRQRVAELTVDQPALLDKIEAVAAFVQQDIRYVAIEIGIGGYLPHPARDVFANRYGDCKDKATLLATMLAEMGIESHYVLVNSRRGVVAPEAPTVQSFDHAILALRLPPEVPSSNLYSSREDEQLGRLLFFDPTDVMTPLGYLPANLQASRGLVVTEEGGSLVELPLMAPVLNRFLRQGKFALSATGDLSGSVQEIRFGAPAVMVRGALLAEPVGERTKVLEGILAGDLGGFQLQGSGAENVEEYDKPLLMGYRLLADQYAKKVGNLLLVRPRVLGRKAMDLGGEKERKYPVEFISTSTETDIVEIALPPGYIVDELPPPVVAITDFAEYRSEVDVQDGVLRYRRDFVIKDVQVSTERWQELKEFNRQIAVDERSLAVLKQTVP